LLKYLYIFGLVAVGS